MRFYKIFCSLLVGYLLIAHPAWAQPNNQERILSFQSLVTIHPNATLTVTETIKIWSTGNIFNHGIYRDFPTDYTDRMGIQYHVGLTVLSVERDGAPENYHLAQRSNGIRIYIGNREISISPGQHAYTLTYETNRQIGFFEKFDELYWNVTGTGWAMPILEASAIFELPPGATVLSTEGYTGPYGSKNKNFSVTQDFLGRPNFRTTVPLYAGEGLTAVVSWPKGFVQPPSATAEIQYLAQDNLGLLAGMLGLLLILIYYFSVWYLLGRDPKKGTIIPLYHPPTNLCPASIRMIRKMGFDNKTFTIAILNMAVKNFLKIIEHDNALLNIFGAGRSFVLQKNSSLPTPRQPSSSLNKPITDLTPEEFAIATILFGSEEEIALKNENYRTFQLAIKSLNSRLSQKLEKIYFLTNKEFFAAGAFLSGLVGFFTFAKLAEAGILLLFVWAGIILLNIMFYHLLKAPTLQGRKIMDQIEGFRMFLTVTEKERLKLLNPPEKTPELFERYLPYALALDVEQAWGEQFSEILRRAAETGDYHPTWYYGGTWTHFNAASFSTGLNSSFSSAIASASTPPGSSSGGGGGGFSGGGGGGGGGGGW
jgi:uncharacterized membrane protein YgcG